MFCPQYLFMLQQKIFTSDHLHLISTPSFPSRVGLPWQLSGKESNCQCRSHQFNPWFGKIPSSRNWQPTPACLPGKCYGQKSLVGCSSWGHNRVGHDLVTKQQPALITTNLISFSIKFSFLKNLYWSIVDIL